MAIRIDTDVVPVRRDRSRLKISEVEAGKTGGRTRLVVCDSQASFDMVVHGVTGGDERQGFRIPERHVIIGELHAQAGVPRSTRSYVVNAFARLQIHLPCKTDFELLETSRVDRPLSEPQ